MSEVGGSKGRSFGKYKKLLGLTVAATAFALATVGYTGAQEEQNPLIKVPPEARQQDRTLQLGLKINDPFTVATVGDIIEPEPIGDLSDPRYQNLIKLIRSSDVGFANMEMSLVDMHHRDHFQGPVAGTLGPKEVGASIKAMGITLMSRANNHALDGEAPGMFSTDSILDDLGIVHAGSGHSLQEARAASYLPTPRGRVALVSMMAFDSGVDDLDPDHIAEYGAEYVYMSATERIGDMGGRAGIDPLRMTTEHLVSPDEMQMLRNFRDAYFGSEELANAANGGGFANQIASNPNRLKLFDEYYEVGTPPGHLSYDVNADDEKGILESIRNGKYKSDFLIATIHAHNSAELVNGERTTEPYMIQFAHECIDNGADMFVTTGPHMLEGVEIYKGKPIFYDLNGFIFQTEIQISGSTKSTVASPGNQDLVARPRNGFDIPSRTEGILARSSFSGGRLVEVRLYPYTLGSYKTAGSDIGIPMTAPPDLAQDILQQLQTLSKPYGTKINIENNIGVIRVAADGTTH